MGPHDEHGDPRTSPPPATATSSAARPGELAFAVSTQDDQARIRVIGELDIATADDLGRTVDQCLRDGHRRIVLDLADLTFIDATGLRVLVRARRNLEAASGGLELVNLRPLVRRVLTLTGLTAYLGAAPEGARASTPEGRP